MTERFRQLDDGGPTTKVFDHRVGGAPVGGNALTWSIDVNGNASFSGLAGTFLQAGTGAQTRTSQDKLRDEISAFDFMTAAQVVDVLARTASLDVSVAVQTAINYAIAAKRRLRLPGGIYLCNTAVSGVILNIQSTDGVTIEGDGSQNTIIKTTTAGVDLMAAISITFANPRYTLSGFSLYGPDTGASATSGNGLRISGAAVPLGRLADIKSYYFKGSGKAAMWLDGPEDGGFRDLDLQLSDIGLKTSGAFNGNVMSNVLCGQNESYGIYLTDTGSNTWNGMVVQSNKKHGWYVDGGCHANVINAPHFENNNTSATVGAYTLALVASAAKGSVGANVFNAVTWNATANDRMYIAGEAGWITGYNQFNEVNGAVLLTIGNAFEAHNTFNHFVSIANITGWNGTDTVLGFAGEPNFFPQDLTVPDEAFGPAWNGSLEVPTKNAVYDAVGTMTGGIYAPAVVLVTNLDAAFIFNTATYTRVGNVVSVDGIGNYDPTIAGVVQFTIALPIPSNFAGTVQLFGTLVDALGKCGTILADVALDVALVTLTSTATGSTTFTFHFAYQVI